MYFSSTVALSFFYYVIKFVGESAETLLVCLINVLDLHVVTIAKLYVIKNLNLNSNSSSRNSSDSTLRLSLSSFIVMVVIIIIIIIIIIITIILPLLLLLSLLRSL